MTAPGAVLVTGATGLVGRRLVARLTEDGVSVRALTRRLGPAAGTLDPRAILVRWDGSSVPAEAVRGVDAVVHLAGEPVFGGLPTEARKHQMRTSRVDVTRHLVETIGAVTDAERPDRLVCASAVGFYGDHGDEILDEAATPGDGFLAELCRDWEDAAAQAVEHGLRVVSLRIGIVLARKGGALPMMALPFRFGLGGRVASGRQWFPWIHIDDLVSMLQTALANDAWQGVVNAVAPEPTRNADFTRALARVLHRPALLPVPAFAVRAALGDLAAELLDSRRVIPRRALETGFEFEHERVETALAEELTGPSGKAPEELP